MNAIEVLIVEDEKHLADGLRFNLEAEGYSVETIGDGDAALTSLLAAPLRYAAVVLDVMLPGKDGFTIARELRRAGQFVPILMLTARGRPEDVLRGFEAGADDYLPKPFELRILLARLRSLLRRGEWSHRARPDSLEPTTNERAAEESSDASQADAVNSSAEDVDLFTFDGKAIDFGRLELRAGGRTVRLTLMESELLRYLIRHEGRVVSRKLMLEEVWGLHEDTDTRAIDNFIVRLRKYIEEKPSQPKHLLTVRGVGYRFVASAA
ncbi:MAG: response regulator transcription factor [Pyrinomonadaceae bacterium]